MDMHYIFEITGPIAIAGWLLLLFSPLAPVWINRISGFAIPVVLGLFYTGLSTIFFTGVEGGFGSLTDVMLLFKNEQAVMAGWLHYLAFDLFIGAWQVRHARKIGMPFWMVLPALPLTFMFGPVGLVLFLIILVVFKNTDQKPAQKLA